MCEQNRGTSEQYVNIACIVFFVLSTVKSCDIPIYAEKKKSENAKPHLVESKQEREREREREREEKKKKGTTCRPLSLLIDESLCGPAHTSNYVVSHWSFRCPRMQFLPGWVTTHDDMVTFDRHSIHALLFTKRMASFIQRDAKLQFIQKYK